MDLVSLMQFHQKTSVVPWSWSDCPLSQRVSFPPFLEYCTLPWAHLHSWSCFLNFTDNCSTRLCTAAAVTTFIMICSSGQKRLINVFQNSNWKWKQKELFYIVVGFFSCGFFFLSNSCISLVHPPSHAAVCLRLHWMNEHEWNPRKCIFTRFLLFTVLKKA